MSDTLFSFSLNSNHSGCISASISYDGSVYYGWREETITLSEESLKKILSIVSSNSIYEIQEIEEHDEDFYSGYEYEFFFQDGERQTELTGNELEICLKKPERYPHALLLLDILHQIHEICVSEGVPSKYFMPADVNKAIYNPRRHYTQFVVYDFRDPEAVPLHINNREWLEHYIFRKDLDNNCYEVAIQCGWNAGSHNDGGERVDILPQEWFESSWDSFLDHLTKALPKGHFGYGKEELLPMKELKEYLGFQD